MLSREKILVTGAAGRVAFPIARELAKNNEVWGAARFSNPADRDKLTKAGIRPVKLDVSRDSFDSLPADFTYVFHAAAALSQKDAKLGWGYFAETNAQATGRLLYHCRHAKGFLYCSTGSVYQYQGHRAIKESDPPGIHNSNLYAFSKIAGEEVCTWLSRQYRIPVTIIRICSTYGPEGGAPADRLDRMVQGKEIVLHPDKPNNYNPIYEDDYIHHGIKALEVAKCPPEVVNWSGSETVSAEDYMAYMGKLLGLKPKIKYSTEAYTGLWPDTTHMHEVLGHTKVGWKEGMRRMVQAKYPDRKLHDVK
ncbi:MAG: NAD(P)-dependent oxidoreductase [Chloroflexi bacterium]|nr:NAD(P)-dependent oxidoreductase [Chloroflexota bacterium]